MPHFRVDDGLDSHPKAQRAGDEALGMWVRAGSWCMRYLTDGFVPDWWVKQQPKGLAKAKKLVAAGLWNDGVVHDGEKGYRFHEFTGPGRQDSREQIEADRDKWRQKKQRQRGEASSMSPGDRSGDTPRDKAGDTRESPGYTQPNPTLKNSGEPKSVSPDSTASEPRSAPVTPAANRLVSEHIPATHPAAVRTELRLQASALLKDGQSEELVGAALALWTTKSLHPKTLPSLVSELINGRSTPAPGAVRPALSTADQRESEQQAALEAKLAAIALCEICDPDGYDGTRVCDHVDRSEVAKAGAARARAALENPRAATG